MNDAYVWGFYSTESEAQKIASSMMDNDACVVYNDCLDMWEVVIY